MRKTVDFYKSNYKKDEIEKALSENRTIFLDIDGVLQLGTEKRSNHDNYLLMEYLAKKYNDDIYLKVREYDIGAVYYDWRHTAVGVLKDILDTTISTIVLHSDWRDRNFDFLKAFFRIYDLDDYLVDVTDHDCNIPKKDSINNYLKNHPEIKKYLILDDRDFYKEFGPNFRLVRNKYNSLTNEDYEYAKFFFNVDKPSTETDKVYSFDTATINKTLFEIDGKKILYLDNLYMDYKKESNAIYEYMLADIFNKHKDADLVLFKDELNLDLMIGYKDRYGLITINRNINDSIFSDEMSNIKCKVLKKVSNN